MYPLQSIVNVKWRNGIYKAQIIDASNDKYYVHYMDRNLFKKTYFIDDRRLDSWISQDSIVEESFSIDDQSPELEESLDLKLTRNMKRKYEQMNLSQLSQIDPKFIQLEKEREEVTKIRNIHAIVFQHISIETWYFSPFPDEYAHAKELYICSKCLKYMLHPQTWAQHEKNCQLDFPGKRIYSHQSSQIYEIDGKEHKLFCQCLCLLAKLFLDHKTVYYDIEPFLFYLLTETKIENGKPVESIVGYFSKEKVSLEGFNLACILVFPHHQRKGYGRLLIEFSNFFLFNACLGYELSKLEKKIGSPERPLSDLGLVGYRSYWQSVLLNILKKHKNLSLTIQDLSTLTSIRQEDIVSTLSSMEMIRLWKGEHTLCVTPNMVTDYIKENKVNLDAKIDRRCITDFVAYQEK
jgi:histone acetyltransferase MYST1